ncbi:MAG TPA: VWA domain-containing protein [Terriglobales bacterium]|jgi:VWFA-related protein|nr:VWA domain-containing protein [Terriglobales bacterium]
MPKVPVFQSFAGLLLIAYLSASVLSQAQQMPRLVTPDQSPAQDQSEDQSISTLKVNVNVVQLFFNVKDKKGGLIPSLPKDEFEILEDSKPQTIKYFTAESNLPLTLGILIDSSGSQQRVLDMEKEIGGAFLSQILREKDMAFVLGFDVNVDLLQDFTNSPRLLKAALNSAKINTGGGSGAGIPGMGGGPVPTSNPRGTLLYDAVYLASHDELAQQVGRKAMILLTDGEDQGSQLKLKDAVEAAQKSDSIVYVLLCADRGFYGGFGYSGEGEMKKLTQETGGRVIDVGNKPEKLKQAFDQIALELRSQYNIGYTPSNSAQDGTFRKVEIHTKNKDYKIQARTGYYAGAKRD